MNDLQVSFVDAQSFINNLNDLFVNCDKLDIAIAYVKTGGLKTLLTALNRSPLIKESLPIRIVFGLCSRYGITDKDAARKLFELSQEHENIKVKKLNCPGFHPKLMIFHGNPNKILLGSSNLTAAAQTKNIEANIIVESPEGTFFTAVNKFFEDCFTDAIFLNKDHVENYTQHGYKQSKHKQKYPKEDETPSFPINVSPLKNRRLVFDPKRSKKDQQWDILLPVTRGIKNLEVMRKKRYGKWTIGKSVVYRDFIQGGNAYFYVNRNKTANLMGKIESINIQDRKTTFTINKIKNIKNRKLNSFKKRDGKTVEFVGSFVYISK